MGEEFDRKFKEFNKWYQHHHHTTQPTRDLKNQVGFLTDAMDEAIFLLAHACRDIRRLEGREGTGIILPAATGAHMGVAHG
jgi:hypothetical protein